MIDEMMPPEPMPEMMGQSEQMVAALDASLSAEPAPQAPEIVLDRDEMLAELLEWATNFVEKSSEWRKSSFEDNWRKWARNADSIYDPEISAKKEAWQSRAVWPITASHRENAQAALFKTEMGPNPPLEYKSRTQVVPPQMPGMPPVVDQGQLIRDLVLWEREKAQYPTGRNSVLEDKTTFGSGFARLRFETKTEPRKVKVPQYAPIDPNDQMSVMAAMQGQRPVVGYSDDVQEVVVYRGVRFEHISIWDIFPDPKALQIKGHPIAHRYNTTYGEVVQGVELGYYLPECVEKLKNRESDEETPEDKQPVESDREITPGKIKRPEYGKNIECFQIEARLPKKWVLINGEPIDDPERLIPAVVQFKKGVAVISTVPSESYDGEPMIYKDDYFPVAGQFYGRGIPEMLKDVHLVSTETINQRLDAGSVSLMQKFAVVEKFLVDPKDIEEDRRAIRLRAPAGSNIDDVRKVFSRIDMGAPDRSSFVEPQEWERVAQERTSITQTTLGTEDNANTTLGAQQIQQGVTGGKMAYLGMLSEYDFQAKISHGIWALIYQNYNPEDYAMALGPEKAQQLQLMSPDQVAQNYRMVPKGIFESENKAKRQGQVAALTQQYGMDPWFNRVGSCKSQIASVDEDESTFILPEADAIQITQKAQMMAQGMAQQMAEQAGPQKPGGPPR